MPKPKIINPHSYKQPFKTFKTATGIDYHDYAVI